MPKINIKLKKKAKTLNNLFYDYNNNVYIIKEDFNATIVVSNIVL